MNFEKQLTQVADNLRKGRFVSEAAISQGVILPVLGCLSWPVFDTSIVVPEYVVDGRRVDFALCRAENRPVAFLEAKKVGNLQGGDKQLFEYAYHQGVQLVVLTDGQEWHFYLPAEQGSYEERRVYKLDLLERTPDECISRLSRYLDFSRACSGEAIDAARKDFKDVAKKRIMEEAFPEAWKRILEEQDAALLELLADKVEDISGYRPELEKVSVFLRHVHVAYSTGTEVSPRPTIPSPPPLVVKVPKHPASPVTKGFRLNGQHVTCKTAMEVTIEILRQFAQRDASFLSRFASRKHGRKRQLVSTNRDELYRGRPDLCANYARELIPGWWIGTNYSQASLEKLIELACEVAGLKYGFDLKVNW